MPPPHLLVPRSDSAGPRPGRGRRRPVVALLALLVVAGAVGLAVAVAPSDGSSAVSPPLVPPAASNTDLGQIVAPDNSISDPFVLPGSRVDYMYSGGLGQVNLAVRRFTTLGHWTYTGEALPSRPSWVAPGTLMWSPDVRKIGNHYVMWFTAQWGAHTIATGAYPKCMGWATATSPLGPFVSTATAPAVCQLGEFGDIDPRTFQASDGQLWLYWKSDDNADHNPAIPTRIWVQPLERDGVTFVPGSQPVAIYQNSVAWEGAIVEAPQMVHVGKGYYLFFSGNSTHYPQNGIGVASCRSLTGPCATMFHGPFLGDNATGVGPGEESLFQQNGNTWLLYTPHALFYPGAFPQLAVSRVAFGPDGPYIAAFDGAKPGP